MDADFYTRVADRFGGYFSDACSTDLFPDGRPDTVFDEWVNALAWPGARLVDAGCADGRRLLGVADGYGDVLGIDLSPSMLDCCRGFLAESGFSHVAFELYDADRTGLDGGSIDVVTSRRGPTSFREFFRVLRPGGILLYMGIGEQDARALKETIGRGQDFGSWLGSPATQRIVRDLADEGLVVTREREFRFDEFYHSPSDLNTFLQQVPIVEDFDPEADADSFDRYVARATDDRGIWLGRHWYVVQAQKPEAAAGSSQA